MLESTLPMPHGSCEAIHKPGCSSVQGDLGKAKTALREADKKLSAEEKSRRGGEAQTKELASIKTELGALRQEREDVRLRIAKLVEVLDGLD